MLVVSQILHHHALLVEAARGQEGVEDAPAGHHPGAPSQDLEVPLGEQVEFPGLLAVEDEFQPAVSLEFLVLEPISEGAAEPDKLTELLRGAESPLQPQPLRIVERDGTGPWTITDASFLALDIARNEHGGQTVGNPVELGLLKLLRHLEDALLPVRQVDGTGVGPPGVVLFRIASHLDLVASGEGFRLAERPVGGVGIDQSAVSQEGNDLGVVVCGDGEIDEEAFFFREPAPVVQAAVFDVHVDMPDPVHV